MNKKLEQFLTKIMGGSSTERALKRIRPMVDHINEFAEEYENLSDDELKAKTNEFRYRLRTGETLDDILPEAFAVVKDTCRRLLGKKWMVRGQETEWNMVPYDVQLLGAIVLHEGKIAEMATGEGKTLAATMPLYLNALEGKGAHLITVNDYLAQRDCEWMGEIYKFLGLSVAAIYGEQDPEERKKAYQADITYGTNNEFGFDYLRDNMTSDVWSVVQRPLHYAIIDEVDSVLIDEARTPLIISGSVGAPRNIYNELKPTVESLHRKQKELVGRLLEEGKSLLDKDEEKAGLLILRAQRGDPKNEKLLELLTSEFWVKKLIERIQGQFEVNKEMNTVDQELYYTIDEKSHVVDITEKGRIFLSGGQALNVADKINQLDDLDDMINHLSEQKNPSQYFTQDPITGYCNGFTLEGKLALLNMNGEITDKELNALDELDQKLAALSEESQQASQGKKGDKGGVWRKYYDIAKKMDRAVNGLVPEGKQQLSKGSSGALSETVEAFDLVLNKLRETADVDGDGRLPRQLVEERRKMQQTFFENDKQSGCPVGLTEQGRIALLAAMLGGSPLTVPMIFQLEDMLDSSDGVDDKSQEYFDFTDNGSAVSHIAEKGRILLLGGNPDLYVLPDRSMVEERDQQIQQLLDRTLNQVSYDYSTRVQTAEQLQEDLQAIHQAIKSQPEEKRPEYLRRFYDVDYRDKVTNEPLMRVTEKGKAFLEDFSSQTISVVEKLDDNLHKKNTDVFKVQNNKLTGLADEQLDEFLGDSFQEINEQIDSWNASHSADAETSSVTLREHLDSHLGQDPESPSSLSRLFEEVERIDRVLRNVFSALASSDVTDAEKRRILNRYFEVDTGELENIQPTPDLDIRGLSETGMQRLIGRAADRREVTDRMIQLLENPETELESVFEMEPDGYPSNLKESARSHLVDGLPYYEYSSGLKKFRDEVLQLSANKVSSGAEMESLVPKEQIQLKKKGIALSDRELGHLISKAHAPNTVITSEEIEAWFRLHFNELPRRYLESRRDQLWQDYTKVEERVQNISQLLRAYTLFQRDVDYVVKAPDESEMRRHGGQRGHKAVMIVDQFTGRLMPGRRFSEGLHEALEAKEGVQVQAETQTLATITLQNFFRIYDKLSGMTGTAETEAQEFFSTYELDVIVIPTNEPVIRDDHDDVIYRTRKEKYEALINEALEMHNAGRPVLIGTISVDVSQHLSDMFTARGVPVADWLKKGDVEKQLESGKFHTVLNAKYHKNEAEIVAKAGLPGAITIATNMAGRGTDIKLAPGVREKGGLAILGSEKHEARRIDRQLRGRAGRQGDPGSSRFYLSLEDDLMRLFGSDRITNIMTRVGSMEEGERIEHPLITKSIERAQKKVEERNFEIRKQLLEYDDVLNEQRKIIYKRRQNLLGFAEPEDLVEAKIKRFMGDESDRSTWHLNDMVESLRNFFGVRPPFTADELETQDASEIRKQLTDWVAEQSTQERHREHLRERHRIYGYCDISDIIRELVHFKIRLHGGTSGDTSKWNIEGLQFELDRIFGAVPEWLQESLENLSAEEAEKRLVEWAQHYYAQLLETHKDIFDRILFRGINFEHMLTIYVHGLAAQYLPESEPAINWNINDFFDQLERVFKAQPEIGTNEIRTISYNRLLEKLNDWIRQLDIPQNEENYFRHRIIGHVSPQGFVDMVVLTLVRRINGSLDVKTVSPDLQKALTDVFSAEFTIDPEDNELQPIGQLVRQARQSYASFINQNMDAYDAVTLAKADNVETLEAAITAKTNSVFEQYPDPSESRRELYQDFGNMFLDKPELALPNVRDDKAVAAFKEDLISWGHGFYKTYSDHVDRMYQERLSNEIVFDTVLSMIDDAAYTMIRDILGQGDVLDQNQLRRVEAESRLVFRRSPRLVDDSVEGMNPNDVMDKLSSWSQDLYHKRVKEIGKNLVTRYERIHILQKIDTNWRQHLSGVDELREGIGLRGYGQKDPLLEYKREAFDMFQRTVDTINRETVGALFKFFDVGGEVEEQHMRRGEPQNFTTSHSRVQQFKTLAANRKQEKKQPAQTNRPGQPAPQKTVVKSKEPGRNDPCPCGSGKKYKKCCGRNV